MPVVEIGTSTVAAPAGWRETSRTEDKVCLQSEDGTQQATLSVTQFVSNPTFEQFQLICDTRYKGEKRFLSEGFIEPDIPEPFTDGTIFGMAFCGGDRATRRVFSGYLSLVRGELITIYVEGSPPAENTLDSFKAFVAGLRRVNDPIESPSKVEGADPRLPHFTLLDHPPSLLARVWRTITGRNA